MRSGSTWTVSEIEVEVTVSDFVTKPSPTTCALSRRSKPEPHALIVTLSPAEIAFGVQPWIVMPTAARAVIVPTVASRPVFTKMDVGFAAPPTKVVPKFVSMRSPLVESERFWPTTGPSSGSA